MMKNDLNWGLIGDGFIAHRFAGNLQTSGIPMQAVLARNFSKAQKFAQHYGIKKAYRSPEEFFADKQIQAVYIATPNSIHYAYIKRALQSGKHVLCEKPMVINSRQFEQAAALAKQKKLILEEAYTPFHMPVMKKIQAAIAADQIGTIKQITANFWQPIDLSNPHQRVLNPALGGGNLLDMGCYPICFALMFLPSNPLKLQSQVQMGATGVDLSSSILLKSGAKTALLSSAFTGFLPKDGLIAGTHGCILVKHFSRSDTAQVLDAAGHRVTINAGNSDQAWTYEAKDMATYVQQGHDSGQLASSRRIIRVMDQLRQQWHLHYPFE